ncbi:probable receptor-like protein kinase At1g30570 [Andrographis paniculata]|uniref:probable receptor-like protein kinase At1g30570 n=1 Tax=Andrographis paniculata TaxID=175694 RepID=UPI0021E7632D|nr:probable receptor-like protein kinase At1g30570 [Andrographis paniculata]
MALTVLLLVIILKTAHFAEAATTSFLVNCGSSSRSVNVDGRAWVGDGAPGTNFTLSDPGIPANTTVFNGDSIYRPLYSTARIFTANSNYTFRVPNGDYFLRLHFYPLEFDGYDVNKSSFSIEANGLKLVSNFNVPTEIQDRSSNLQSGAANSTYFYLLKEYFFSVHSSSIIVNFVPLEGSFSFISAIEVVTDDSKLFTDNPVRRVNNGGNGNASLNLIGRGVETMHRLKVGGLPVKPSQDSFWWRTWEADEGYMINAAAGVEIRNRSNISYADPNSTVMAPLAVYETARSLTNNAGVSEKRFNMSWKLDIDPDFDYLVRLHFCELLYDKPNQRVFRVFINNRTASDNFDIYVRAGGMNRAYHEDYLDFISSESNTLWIQLGPDTITGSAGTDALLNGLEVFKLSRNGNLAYERKQDSVKGGSGSRSLVLWIGIGAGIASITIIAGVFVLIVCCCKKKDRKTEDGKKNAHGWRPLFLHGSVFNSTANAKGPNEVGNNARSGRRFALTEIRSATNNFDESLVIGVGGFGKVYKGEIDETTLVAIKRANPQSQQGLTEFETEIEMLSKLRHRHLVSLIGFCDEQNEMILVYEYMANGTLRSHLFGSDLPPLSWKQRLEICIGSARGLHYLHTGSDRGIIHRDVKTTNILLDENFVAKMSDFGLSKTGPSLEHTHVSTAVKGSFGYLDPEYFRRQQLTEKSDVYSFGVVLFEVACARAVINPTLPKDEINLAEWALRWQREGSLDSILDAKLRGDYCPESLVRFGEVAEKCLADEGKSRPTMGEVLWHLEYVLQLHDSWLQLQQNDEPGAVVVDMSLIAESESESLNEK